MKNRIGIFWMAALTVYSAYTATDTYNVLNSVKASQGYTLQYMQKSADILYRLKKAKIIEPQQTTANEGDRPSEGSDQVAFR